MDAFAVSLQCCFMKPAGWLMWGLGDVEDGGHHQGQDFKKRQERKEVV